MASPVCLDNFEALLEPISGDNPCGIDLRHDPVFDEIKRHRSGSDKAILVDSRGAEAPPWQEIIVASSTALARRSKDLTLVSWLIEALTEQHGFAGLRDGLQLLTEMLRRYWDGIYPLPDEDGDLEPRASRLEWLTSEVSGSRLPNRVREIPLAYGEGGAFSWTFWKSQFVRPKGEMEEDGDYEQRKAEAADRSRRFSEAEQQTTRDDIQRLYEDIGQSLVHLSIWHGVVNDLLGNLAPGITALRTAIEDCQTLVGRILRDKGGELTSHTSEVESQPSSESNHHGQPTAPQSSSGPIRSREEAYRRVAEVAHFLRGTEPHSPVPMLIEQAIAWGRLPADQLYKEIIRNPPLQEILGIGRADSSTSE